MYPREMETVKSLLIRDEGDRGGVAAPKALDSRRGCAYGRAYVRNKNGPLRGHVSRGYGIGGQVRKGDARRRSSGNGLGSDAEI